MKFPKNYSAFAFAAVLLFSACGGSDDPSPSADTTPFITAAGKEKDDRSFHISVDAAGNSYVTGFFNTATQFGDMELTGRSGYYNMFLTKYDPKGKALWAKASFSEDHVYGEAVAVDKSNNVYVTGTFYAATALETKSLTANGNSDIYVAKYGTDGSILWAKQLGGENVEMVKDIAVDGSGNVYVVGGFTTSLTVGSVTLESFGSIDIFMVKYTPEGEVVWAKAIGGGESGGDLGYAICVDASGNVYITGSVFATATIGGTQLEGENTNMILAKYNASGDFQWVRRAVSNDFMTRGAALATDASGNIYVGGYLGGLTSFGDVSLPQQSGAYGFLVKYNSSGKALWAQNLPHNGYELSLAVDKASKIYVTGRFGGTESYGETDSYVAQYDTGGKAQWTKQGGGTDHDYATGIAVDDAGNIYSTGFFSSKTFKTDEGELSNVGLSDSYVWKFRK